MKRYGEKNFEFRIENSCIPQNHILLLESSQGGNSHQSETNLIERPLKQHLPGARKGLSRSFRNQTLNKVSVHF
jgi:hypothetical protein